MYVFFCDKLPCTIVSWPLKIISSAILVLCVAIDLLVFHVISPHPKELKNVTKLDNYLKPV